LVRRCRNAKFAGRDHASARIMLEFTTQNAKPRRHWPQFRLKTLLLVTAVLCVPLAWMGGRLNQKRQERAAIAELEKLGGIVMYGWQGGRVNGVWRYTPTADESTGPDWMRQIFSDDFFTDVVYVALSPIGHQPVGFHRTWTPDLSVTDTDAAVKDDDLRLVGMLSRLEELDQSDTDVGDSGLVHLQGLANLHCLDLSHTNITDAGLLRLKSLTALEFLGLFGTKRTTAGVDDLAKALPGCAIWGRTDPAPSRSAGNR
jgi:hypothetical protein